VRSGDGALLPCRTATLRVEVRVSRVAGDGSDEGGGSDDLRA
jgi:hypothetical protein